MHLVCHFLFSLFCYFDFTFGYIYIYISLASSSSSSSSYYYYYYYFLRGEGCWVCKMELAQSHILMLESGHAGHAVEISRKSHGCYSQETSEEKQTQLA